VIHAATWVSKSVFALAALATLATTAMPAAAQPAVAEATPLPLPAATSRLFVVHLTTGPGWQKDVAVNAQNGFREHSANLHRLRSEGKLIVGARYQDSQADKGMLILRLPDRAAVEREFATDPMVGSRHFSLDIAEFNPFYSGFIERPPAPSAGAPATPLTPLGWLAGCWEGRTTAGGRTTVSSEQWMPEAGGVLLGMGRTLRDGRLVSFESVRIVLDSDGQTPVYIAHPSGQKETRFALKGGEGGRFVFENLAHDFPHRVIYQREPDGSLFARIEGERSGQARHVDYRMKRAGCG
jgi:Domain of unknown function (DUF6265)